MLAGTTDSARVYTEPRSHASIDVEEQARLLPPNAHCKGIYFSDMFAYAKQVNPRADLFEIAGVPPRRYVPFLDYPHAEWMRIAAASASVIRPGRVSEGLRELGRRVYDVLFKLPLGRVIFSPVGFDVEQVLAYGPAGYRLCLSFGQVTAQRLGKRHFLYTFRDMPTFLDSYNVGVIEGGILHYDATPRIVIAMEGLGTCWMDVTWT